MPITINELQIENIKRVKAVKLEPKQSGLTVIGGKNGQGKTSVLDAIAWALGGNKFKPSNPANDYSVIPPFLSLTLSNGLVVERKGKNSELKVTDPQGRKAGQSLLDDFINQLSLNLPQFLQANSKEKAQILLQILGVGDKLAELDQRETYLYNQRHAIGQIADQKEKFALELPTYPDAPDSPVSASELIGRQQGILAQNGENQRKRENLAQLERQFTEIQQQIEALQKQQKAVRADLETARKSALDLQDESTEELERDICNIEDINIKVRANLDKAKAEDEAHEHRKQYEALTSSIDKTRQERLDLLKGADLPLPGLSVEDGELLYNGQKWDCMSGADQLKVAVAIIRKTKPECGFVLVDKLEQMDLDSLQEFSTWLEAEGLQAIATRVSTGDECHIIIEDGCAVEATPEVYKEYEEGVF